MKKFTKISIFLIIAMFIASTFFACGPGNDDDPTAPSDDAGDGGATTTYTLNLSSADDTMGTVSANPASGPYAENSIVRIRAERKTGYHFVEWSGDGIDASNKSTNPLDITMDADKTITATFDTGDPTTYTLNLSSANDTMGTVSADPELGTGTYDENTSVRITATPNAESEFLEWRGDGIDASNKSTNPIDIIMDADKTITAVFAGELTNDTWRKGDLNGATEQWFYFDATESTTYDIHTHDSDFYHPDNPGASTFDNEVGVYKMDLTSYDYDFPASGSGQEDIAGSTDRITIAATETTVYVKVTPYGGSTGSGSYFVKFSEPADLTVALADADGGTPAGSVDPAVGTHRFPVGGDVTLEVTPDAGWHFVEWSGVGITDANKNDNPVTIVFNATGTITATIQQNAENEVTLTTKIIGDGTLATSPVLTSTGICTEDSDVVLTATPNAGSELLEWRGDGIDASNRKANPLTITMDDNKKITAVFVAELTDNNWKEDDLNGATEQWFYFDATESTTYDIHTHDLTFYHPDNPGASTFDNKVGVYKMDLTSYTYDFPASGSGQVDIYLNNGVDRLTITATETKVYVKVTPYGGGKTGNYYVKFQEHPDQYTLNLASIDEAKGTVSANPKARPTGTYDAGTIVTITATPKPGYHFAGWDSDDANITSSTTSPLDITMDSNKGIQGIFVDDSY